MKTHAMTRSALRFGVAAIGLAAPIASFAQTAPVQPENEAFANEIVVTATKRDQTLQDVPVAVSVTTADTLERAQIRDIKDLGSVVPSLRVGQLQSAANTNFFIRGFGNGANNAGIEPSVGVFIDGVYRSRSAAQIGDFPDVERIEVLRGPQSTLFGKNASAGVISIVTEKPQFDLGGNVEATYGNYDAVTLKGVVTGPLSETVAASLSGGFNKRDGYNRDEGPAGGTTNERNRWFMRGQLLFEPTKDLSVRIIGDYGKIDENCCGVVNVLTALPTMVLEGLNGSAIAVNSDKAPFGNVVYNNIPSINKIKNYGISGQVDYISGALKFTSITAWRKVTALSNQDSDFTGTDLLGRNWQDQSISTLTQEFRVASDYDGPFNFLLGGFYFNEKINQANEIEWGGAASTYADLLIKDQTKNLPGGPLSLAGLEYVLGGNTAFYSGQFFKAGTGLDEAYKLKNEAFSIFLQGDVKPTEQLTLTGGIAYNKDKKSYVLKATSSDVFSGIALPVPLSALRPFQFFPEFLDVPNAVEPGKTSDDQFTYTARLAYDVTDQINAYVSFATGYKASSVNLSRDSRPSVADYSALNKPGSVLAVTNQTYGSRFADPEKSTVYEAGIKSSWSIGTANLAVFKQSIEGFQSNLFTGTGFTLLNAGKQSTFGIEFEGTLRPIRPFTLSLALTYLEPEYDEFKNSACGNATGMTPAGIPKWSGTVGGQYEHEMGSGDKVIARANYHFESDAQIVDCLPGFVVTNASGQITDGTLGLSMAEKFRRKVDEVDASLTYAMQSGLELSIWGRNLTNNRYLISVFDSPAQKGSVSGYTNQPRTYGGAVRYRF